MNVVCKSCQSQFSIADSKIPAGKTASFICPKCKCRIAVTADSNPETTGRPTASEDVSEAVNTFERPPHDADKPSDLNFDFNNRKQALICEPDPGIRQTLSRTLESMQYGINITSDTRDALKKLRMRDFDLIALNEHFDTTDPDSNGVLVYIRQLNASSRRNTYVALISQRFRTMDNMMAFTKSVNLVINTSNIDEADKILELGIRKNKDFYKTYRKCLKKSGRA